jgi:hypothetical protein
MDTRNTDTETAGQACHHMQHHVHALADDTLKGPMRWYTRLHCSYCSQCGTALQTLRAENEPGLAAVNHPQEV